ncbi:MAG: hypothetical protein ACRDNG_07730, partial [Gaiellaceae bacterium]
MKAWRRGRLQWAAATLALVAIGASVVALAAVRRGDEASGLVVEAPPPAAASSSAALADPQAPAFEVPAPVALRSSPYESTWAAVRKVAAARAAPGRRARIVGRIEPRTPEGTANVVLVLERAR